MPIWTATAEHYWQAVRRLLPPGVLWRTTGEQTTATYGDGIRVPRTRLGRLLLAFADELARVHNRARDLVDEEAPATCTETIAAWERAHRLPDGDWPASGGNLAVRRAQLALRRAWPSVVWTYGTRPPARGFRPEDLVAMALAIWSEVVTVAEHGPAHPYQFTVKSPTLFGTFRVGYSRVGYQPLWEALTTNGAGLSRWIWRIKHAHTHAFFTE